MNLLLTGCFDYSKHQLQSLEALGYNLHYIQYEKDDLPIDPATIDAIVCNGLFLHHDLAQFSNLGFIQLTSAGYDRVPVNSIDERCIQLHNARGVYSIPMAEWALFRVLEHYKDARGFNKQQESKQWLKHRNLREVDGTKVAIIGAGNVGQEVGKRFQAMGAYTTGFDIHTSETIGFDDMELTEIFPEKVHNFDIIILTAPLLPSTKGMINERILTRMKDNSIIVNIARGGLIDETALINILSARKNIFAALDVFEEEPLNIDSRLWDMENVAISPHNSFVGNGNNERMFKIIFSNLKSFIEQNN